MKQKIVRLSALIGIAIFAFIIYRIGPAQIWENISKISLGDFFILVALRIVYWMVRTMCWKEVLQAYTCNTSFLQLFIARMVGHSVSQLTPTAQVGSEATRIYMVDCSDRKISVASVIVDKTIEFMTVVVFIFIGVVVLFYRIPMPVEMKTYFVVGLAVCLIAVLFLFSKQKKGLLGWIVDLIHRIKLHPKFIEKNLRKIKETDVYISEFYKSHGNAFLKTFSLYALLTMIWVVEIHMGLIFIGVTDMPFVDSFLITVLGNLGLMFPFIPGSLGIYEATYIGLFALVGQSAGAALTLVLIRRVIALLLAGFGLLGMLKPIPKQD